MKTINIKSLILFLLIAIGAADSAYGVGNCEKLTSKVSGPSLFFMPDSLVSYNLGIVKGVDAVPGTPPVYHKANQIYVKYNHYGVAGYRWENVTDAYTTPGTPGSPGSPPNINSDNPQVIVTAQPRGNDFMNVTLNGPRNLVLAQILKMSQSSAKDLKLFQDIFPIALAEEELPEAVQLRIKVDQEELAKATEKARLEAESARRAEEAAALKHEELLAAQEQAERNRQLYISRQEAERVAREKQLREERERDIREQNLPDLDTEVQFKISFSTALPGSGINSHILYKAPMTDQQLNFMKATLENSKNLVTRTMTPTIEKMGFWRTSKVTSVEVSLQGSYRDVADTLFELAKHAIPEFRPGFGFSDRRKDTVKEIIDHLIQNYPPKTPVRDLLWQKVVDYIKNSGEAYSNAI